MEETCSQSAALVLHFWIFFWGRFVGSWLFKVVDVGVVRILGAWGLIWLEQPNFRGRFFCNTQHSCFIFDLFKITFLTFDFIYFKVFCRVQVDTEQVSRERPRPNPQTSRLQARTDYSDPRALREPGVAIQYSRMPG